MWGSSLNIGDDVGGLARWMPVRILRCKLGLVLTIKKAVIVVTDSAVLREFDCKRKKD